MNIEDFQQLASASFLSDADVNVITTIHASRLNPTPLFSVTFSSGSEPVSWGSARTPQDAINACKRMRSAEHEAQLAAARKLLGIEE